MQARGETLAAIAELAGVKVRGPATATRSGGCTPISPKSPPPAAESPAPPTTTTTQHRARRLDAQSDNPMNLTCGRRRRPRSSPATPSEQADLTFTDELHTTGTGELSARMKRSCRPWSATASMCRIYVDKEYAGHANPAARRRTRGRPPRLRQLPWKPELARSKRGAEAHARLGHRRGP